MDAAEAVRPYQDDDLAAAGAIAEAALAAGEVPAWTAADLAGWRSFLTDDPGGTIVATAREAVVGFYSFLAAPLLVVGAAHRRRGHGRRLVAAAVAAASRRQRRYVLAQAPGDDGATEFAARLGFAYHSSLWQLRLPAPVLAPPPDFPTTVVARPIRPGTDDGAFVALVNAAFVDHLTAFSVSEDQIRRVHGHPDFDPTQVLVVEPRDRPGQLIGFGRVELWAGAEPIAGEVGLIGVLEAWRGQGIGRALLRWSVVRLRAAGAAEIGLTVEGDNERALRLYEHAGFERVKEWPRWAKDVAAVS